jgi:hypothetical protein
MYDHWSRNRHFWSNKVSGSSSLITDEEAVQISLPTSEDVHGVAHHILRLVDVYNLTVGHLLTGDVMGIHAARPMNMHECFMLVDVAYDSLMEDTFHQWYEACNEV